MLALVVAGVVVLMLGFLFFAQESLLFPAPPRGRPMPPSLIRGAGFVALWIPPEPGERAVVHFHGNGEDLSDLGPIVELYRSLGFGVLAVEVPGYGVAAGKPAEGSLYDAAESALRWLRDEQRATRVVLSGQSLGSGVAVEMAARGWGEKVVLISPYTSMTDVARRIFPWLPVKLLLRHRFDSGSKAPRVQQPALLVHGTDDEVVPFDLGERLSRLLPHATFVPIRGGHHNDLLWLHTRELRDALASFL
jgi:fermentation-respiration switch protein FrsA (DUF1100 family)